METRVQADKQAFGYVDNGTSGHVDCGYVDNMTEGQYDIGDKGARKQIMWTREFIDNRSRRHVDTGLVTWGHWDM